MPFNRRRFIQATGAVAAAAPFKNVFSQNSNPIRIGLVTVKTGPLASGGIDMERALQQYLREHNNTMAGRRVELPDPVYTGSWARGDRSGRGAGGLGHPGRDPDHRVDRSMSEVFRFPLRGGARAP